MKTIASFLALFLLLAASNCALLQRLDEKVERFLVRVLDIVNRWESAGLLPPALAQRVRDAVDWARENWREGKANLLEVFAELLDWLTAHAVPLNDWNAALDSAQADGVLSTAETRPLRSK